MNHLTIRTIEALQARPVEQVSVADLLESLALVVSAIEQSEEEYERKLNDHAARILELENDLRKAFDEISYLGQR